MIDDSNFTFAQGFANDAYAAQLEKDYCSNFVCCGYALTDMHELVRHFEERHVTVDATSYHPDVTTDLISPDTASSSALESPVSTYSATPPAQDLFPTLTAPFTPRESAFSPVHVSSSSYDDSDYHNGAYTTPSNGAYTSEDGYGATMYDNGHDPAPLSNMNVLSPPQAQMCLPPSHLMAHPDPTPPMDAQPYPDPLADVITPPAYLPTIAPIPVYARHPNLSLITDPPLEVTNAAESGRMVESDNPWTVESEMDDNQFASAHRKKVGTSKRPLREKAFRCPHTDCVKSYMNMNGLRYHLSKGACQYSTP